MSDQAKAAGRPRKTSAQTLKKLLLGNPFDWVTPVCRWAEKVLEAAGLPTDVGDIYMPGADGGLVPTPHRNLTLEEEETILAAGGGMIKSFVHLELGMCGGVPWADLLPQAIERLGYDPHSRECAAARVLTHLACAGQVIAAARAGETVTADMVHRAFTACFAAGRIYERHQPSPKVRKGSRKGAAARGDDEEHVQILLLHKRLERLAPETGQNERAQAIAEHLLRLELARDCPSLSEAQREELVQQRLKRKYQQVRKFLQRHVWIKS